MEIDWKDKVWVVNPTGYEHMRPKVCDSEDDAFNRAARIVGNRSATRYPDGFLFGPGDGSATVMVQHLPRAMAPRPNTVPTWIITYTRDDEETCKTRIEAGTIEESLAKFDAKSQRATVQSIRPALDTWDGL